MSTLVLVGPSVDLPRGRRAAWIRRELRASQPDFLIGVDGGIGFLPAGGSHAPNIVIGDWDSGDGRRTQELARRFARGGARMVTLPRKKNFSDLHFALEAALEGLGKAPFGELLLFGFTGGRPDHLLSNLFEIADFAAAHASRTRFQKIAAIGPEAEYHFITHRQPPFELMRPVGTLVSVFGDAQGVSMKGFEYNLRNRDLEPSSLGLSNVTHSRRAEIRVRKGVLLAVVPHGF